MSEQAIKSLLFSALHTLVGVAGGGIVDSFFHAKASEDGLSQVALLAAQTIVNGFLISSISSASIADDGMYQDPTGGAFLIFASLYSQVNYRNRLEAIAQLIQQRTTMLLPSLPVSTSVSAVPTEQLNKQIAQSK
jgi:hypothetical protein